MATASRSERSAPTVRIWCTVPRGTQTMSSLAASKPVPPVSSHSSRPPSTTHHSSKSRCQCGRLPVPDGLEINVTSWPAPALIRLAHGPGPSSATRWLTRVWRTLGQVAFAAVGGHGPAARCVMAMLGTDAPSGIRDSPYEITSAAALVGQALAAQELAGHHDLHHLGGAGTELERHHVAHPPLEGQLIRVAVVAVEQQAL